MKPHLNSICIIYILTNQINGKVYVGQTWRTLAERFGRDGQYYAECIYLNNAIKKYGWQSFSHRKITLAFSQNEADEAEDFFINLYQSRDPRFGYNIRGGGSHGKLSDETKHKLSELNKGENNNFYGKIHSDNVRKLISEVAIKNHSSGKYDNKVENQMKFTKEEEKDIGQALGISQMRVSQLLINAGFRTDIRKKRSK